MTESIVILTGAGVSVESGLPTFRGSADALWNNMRVEEVATPAAYLANPALVLQYYNERRQKYADPGLLPNAAHRALARLQADFHGSVFLVTQNVDDLHERAGSPQVCHMHGELSRMFCTRCQERFDIHGNIRVVDACASCGSKGTLRPDIVWFGEMPRYMGRIHNALAACELFIAVGTSGVVYPAAGFVELARDSGAHTIELNLEPSAVQNHFAEHVYGPAGDTLPVLVDALLKPPALNPPASNFLPG
jgi:NAD-dependent deacetylase